MRIVEILERPVPLSRHADGTVPADGLDTSIVAVRVDSGRGPPVTGFGSIGRFAQGGLSLERFAPRLLSAKPEDLVDERGVRDPMLLATLGA